MKVVKKNKKERKREKERNIHPAVSSIVTATCSDSVINAITVTQS